MKNFEKKEINLNKLIDRLSSIELSYSQSGINNVNLKEERDLIMSEKIELEKKNQDLLREHKYLSNKVHELQEELKIRSELENKFNEDINDLNQETENLVEEIEKWQT